MSRCLVMEAWVYQNEIGVAPDEMGGFTLPGRELPPMTMPQQLLPEGKTTRFAGAGSVGEDDVYLYIVEGRYDGQRLPLADARARGGLLEKLIFLATEHYAPQSFRLMEQNGAWTLETSDLDEDVY